MAGKHVSWGEAGETALGANAIMAPWDQRYKAYAEGRKAVIDGLLVTDNPHPNPSDNRLAWNAGFFSTDAEQYETCYADVP